MAQISDPDEITSKLMARLLGEPTITFGGDLEAVERDMDRFGEQLSFFERNGLSMPCVDPTDDVPLPVDTSDLPRPPPRRDPQDWAPGGTHHEIMKGLVQGLAQRSGMRYSERSADIVKDVFALHLKRFVTSFAQGGGQIWEAVCGSGLRVNVHTRASGLVVHSSPAYLLRLSLFFGAPTTPATGCIGPGRWRFGVTGEGVLLTLDSGVFDIPPTTDAYLSVL